MIKALQNVLLLAFCCLNVNSFSQQKNEWIHVYTNDNKVTSVQADRIDHLSFGASSAHNLQIFDTDNALTQFDFSDIAKTTYAKNVPLLTITTDTYLTEIPSKTEYYSGSIKLEAYGEYDDVETTMTIKGRGNSTWTYAKKPYRLKFDKKISLCGLAKAKNYVLLANYIDPTEIQNAVAMKIAELLDMPYHNHMIPVNVVLNGVYRGSYMLTEKIGFNAGSISDLDESSSILWELDTNYDEDLKFKSTYFKLPVMVKDPDMTDEVFETWKADFLEFEKCVNNSSPLADVLDLQSAVNFILVNNICGNFELNWPKSVYLYKTKGDVYHFGPIWDFDWCFGYKQNSITRGDTKSKLLPQYTYQGHKSIFRKIAEDSDFIALYKETWSDFKTNKLPLLWEFFDEYAELIEPTVVRNNEKWQQSESRDAAVERLRTWLETRIDYIDTNNNFGLY